MLIAYQWRGGGGKFALALWCVPMCMCVIVRSLI
jgi:hypothetical protein